MIGHLLCLDADADPFLGAATLPEIVDDSGRGRREDEATSLSEFVASTASDLPQNFDQRFHISYRFFLLVGERDVVNPFLSCLIALAEQ